MKALLFTWLSFYFVATNVSATPSGGISSGGLPIGTIPADVDFACEAKLFINLQNKNQKNYGVFNRKFVFKEKKGTRIPGYPRALVNLDYKPEEWTADKVKSMNFDANLFEPYVKARHFTAIDFELVDYTKDDLARLTVVLGLPKSSNGQPDPEISTRRFVHLSEQKFDISVMQRIFDGEKYSAIALEIACEKPKTEQQ